MPREPRIKTVDEAKELIRQGAKVWRDMNRNRIVLRMPDGSAYTLPYDDELYNELKNLYEEVKSKMEEEKEPAVPRGRRRPMTDAEVWTTFVGRRRPLVEQLIDRVSWFQSAIIDIGINSMLLTFLMTNPAEADRLPEIVGKLKDRDRFVSFIMDRLVEIYSMSRGKEEIMRLRERAAELLAENAYLKSVLEKVVPATNRLRRYLEVAFACMDERALRRFTRIVTVDSLSRGVLVEKVPEEKGGESE